MVVQTKLYLLKCKVSTWKSESKVLIHEYVTSFPAVVINDMPLVFYDVQATFYEKVKFWSGNIFSNWHHKCVYLASLIF